VENVVYTIYKTNADDNERERTGETDDVQSITISCASEEEEEQQESGSEADEGSDGCSQSDCETEGGDEVEY